ncbi:MAG TPA: S8 family serine peptidase, partial [Bacteroidia bacterium]|nr:S8 family serine peptidase [Bacteroidia bacterium]
MKKLIFLFLTAFSVSAFAQTAPVKAPANWFNLSYELDKTHGVGTERTYSELTKGMKADTIIVCVLDAGVDYNHEDLKDVMWHNPGEIPGNGIDDDKNGYVDDVYGWNFIGGKNGENVEYDNLELVRLYRPLDKRFKGKDANSIAPDEKEDFDQYLKLKADYDKEYKQASAGLSNLNNFSRALKIVKDAIKKQLNVDTVTYANFAAYVVPKEATDQYKKLVSQLKKFIKSDDDWKGVHTEIADGLKELNARLDYNLNLDYDPRHIVGDHYEDATERYYGNPDVKGPDASHGTHVAGIIAANRFNNLGILGIATPVKIMAVRAVPTGDERDKDV